MYRAVEPYRRLMEVVNGFQHSRLLQLGVELDLFTKLSNESKTLLQLARQLEVDARMLELLLNGLVALGLLSKKAERYRSTPLSQTYLVRGGPKYIGSFVRYQARHWSEWEHLRESIRTGKPVREPHPPQDDRQDLELFVRSLHELALARGDARQLAHLLPLASCRTLVDLGGGPGTYAAMLCRSFPNLRAVVVDLPGTIEIARRILREFDLTGNVDTLAADFFRGPIPGAPYDAALLSNVLDGEDEETNAQLLRKVFDALVPGGLLVVKEHCMSPERTEPDHGAVFALSLLLGTRGRSSSLEEMAAWIEAAGFGAPVEIPPEPPMTTSLLLALRPGARPLAVLPSRPTPAVPAPAREPPVLHDWWPAESSQPIDADSFQSEAWMNPSEANPARRAARPTRKDGDHGALRGTRPRRNKKRPAAKSKLAAGRRSRSRARIRRG